MLVTATSEVVRIMGTWVRRADAGLAQTAARNAAVSLADAQVQRMEYVRAMRDMTTLPEGPPPIDGAERTGGVSKAG